MGLLEKFGLTKSANLDKAISIVGDLASTAAPGFNSVMYNWLFNGQPIYWEDNQTNYIEKGYQGNGDVYACVDLIATKLSQCPLILYEVKADKVHKAMQYKSLYMSNSDSARQKCSEILKKDLTETYIPSINDLIARPNSEDTTSEWTKKLVGFLALCGNSYNYYNGLPNSNKYTEMFVLPAPLMHIISGGDLQPVKGYNVLYSHNYNNGQADFPADKVSHFKTFNPKYTSWGSQLYGQSPLRAFIETLVLSDDGRKELNLILKNGGAMGMLSPEQASMSLLDPKVKNDLKEQILGAKTSGDLLKRIFISAAPAKWIQFGLPTTDLQLLEALKLSSADIWKAYHMPPTMMGDTSASTDNNVDHEGRKFVYNAVMPYANLIQERLTRDLCPQNERAGTKLMLMYDLSVLPEMQQNLKETAESLQKMPYLSYNEKRAYVNYGKLDNPLADEVFVNGSDRLLSDLSMTDDDFTNA